jgi:ATP-dependent helicase/DNAse subunit B
MDRLGLSLLVGPANAGKVALLLEHYLDALDREPVLIVPNRPDVDRVERDLLGRRPALLAGSIGTFDDLFRRLAQPAKPVVGDAQRTLLIRRVVGDASLNGLGRSARFAGFADALAGALGELEAGLVEPERLDGDLSRLYAAYRSELDRLGLWDRDLLRRRALERLSSELEAWEGQPVFAYGFEDLTGVEWELLRALAGRTEVTVSIAYEPGRPAFESLRATVDDLSSLADGRIEQLEPRFHEYAHPALAHLERALFADDPPPAPPLDGAVRFFEGAGARATADLVAKELLDLLCSGTRAEAIGVVVPTIEGWRARLETAFATAGIPFAIEARLRLAQTAFGRALLGLLRFVWLGGTRRDLYGFLRSPFSGVPRGKVDFLEGRLRGRAINAHDRVDAETLALHGNPFPAVRALREARTPVAGLREAAATMLRNAHGLYRPPASDDSRADLRAYESVAELADELDDWADRGGTLAPQQIVDALEHLTVRGPRLEPDRVAVLSLKDARTRSFDVVFVLGLEEGSLPRRAPSSPFLTDETRQALADARLTRPDPVAHDRYLFYTACSRATRGLYLVREATTDEGTAREASAFWEEAARVFAPDDVERATKRRPLSALTWPLLDAPTERERLRELARTAATDRAQAEAVARANGWERRLDRALQAFERPTVLRHPLVLEQLAARTTFNVTELERMSDCSSAWFVERLLDPKTIDADVDAKLRGSVAHTTLHRFYAGLPKEVGVDKPDVEHLEPALAHLRACLTQAVEGVRMELTEIQREELQQTLWRDLSAFVEAEARVELPLVPRELELQFGFERSKHAGLALADGLFLSGKIDRVDVEVFGARGIVQDYKGGKSAHSAQAIEQEQRLQIPLYMLVLRDIVGIEPLGGLYRPLAGERKPRGLLRAEAAAELQGFTRTDYVEDDEFWRRLEGARKLAGDLAQRIRAGDVHHDPRGGQCPSWCDLWPMCRVRRA